MVYALVFAALWGCDNTGRSYVEVPFRARGEMRAPFDVNDWSVELDRADLALGPLYLCATESASPEFCDAATLEMLETVTIDALDPMPRELATLRGITGTVRSAMWDYGVSWLGTASRPRVNPGAPDGHSAVFSGVATHVDGRRFEFECALDVPPIMPGALVIRGQRIEAHSISIGGEMLTLAFEPSAWIRRLDFERLADRAMAGENPVVLSPGDPDHEALIVAMTSGALPSFEWRMQ
jgi:hypothetical protein